MGEGWVIVAIGSVWMLLIIGAVFVGWQRQRYYTKYIKRKFKRR